MYYQSYNLIVRTPCQGHQSRHQHTRNSWRQLSERGSQEGQSDYARRRPWACYLLFGEGYWCVCAVRVWGRPVPSHDSKALLPMRWTLSHLGILLIISSPPLAAAHWSISSLVSERPRSKRRRPSRFAKELAVLTRAFRYFDLRKSPMRMINPQGRFVRNMLAEGEMLRELPASGQWGHGIGKEAQRICKPWSDAHYLERSVKARIVSAC
jgi:hypothetical protein